MAEYLISIEDLSEIISQSLYCLYLHPVKLEIIHKELTMDEDTHYDNEYANNLTWDSLVFSSDIKKINVFTQKTGNTYMRGGCGELDIPVEEFSYTIESNTGITLRHLTDAVYRLKGSKYDWFYESYAGIKIVKNDSSSLDIEVYFHYITEWYNNTQRYNNINI